MSVIPAKAGMTNGKNHCASIIINYSALPSHSTHSCHSGEAHSATKNLFNFRSQAPASEKCFAPLSMTIFGYSRWAIHINGRRNKLSQRDFSLRLSEAAFEMTNENGSLSAPLQRLHPEILHRSCQNRKITPAHPPDTAALCGRLCGRPRLTEMPAVHHAVRTGA
jgi:hypothetical protein